MSTADGSRKRCNDVKKIRSYSSIWSVEKVICAINDMPAVPHHLFANGLVCRLRVCGAGAGGTAAASMIDGALLKYFGIPAGITWFMSQKTWDGKKPFSFVNPTRPICCA
ncbi:MAG: TcpE family conjugal transfer membrane protein [Butyricicoccus sp.]